MWNCIWAGVVSLLGLASDTSPAPAPEPGAFDQPRLFAPGDLAQEGRTTFTPTLSPDGASLYFTQAACKRVWQCPQQLYRSRRTAEGWSAPTLVPQTAGNRVDWPSISPDGRYLLFSMAQERARHARRDVYEDFDLYRLDLGDPDASAEPLDEPDINRLRAGRLRTLRFVHNETAPILTASGDLYFWTERPGGPGERDVYVARKDGRGGFQTPQALGAPINSAGNDTSSWLHPGGRVMLISYSDRGGSGDADIFVTTRGEEGWSQPQNLGGVVNSTEADFAARLTPDGQFILFTSDRFARAGDEGVYQVWYLPVSEVPVLARALASVGAEMSSKISSTTGPTSHTRAIGSWLYPAAGAPLS